MTRLPNIILALLSGLLCAAAWAFQLTPLIFVGLVPLFIAENKISTSLNTKRKSLRILGVSCFTFFIWNLLTTWWIYFASAGGVTMAVVANSLFMATAFTTWSNIKQRINKPYAFWLFIPIWLGYEYGITLWDATWTWLNIGNVFAFSPNIVQWYEITGTSGGTLWVLLVNLLIFKTLVHGEKIKVQSFIKPLSIIIIPVILSYSIRFYRSSHNSSALPTPNSQLQTVIVQPNLDPYNEKFYIEPHIQLLSLLEQIKGKITNETDYLILPETFLTEQITENEIENNMSIPFLRDSILARYPDLTIITGANTNYIFQPGEKRSNSARQISNEDVYYDSYNTALQLNKDGIKVYHKSILVPGVERMPFSGILKPLEKLALNMGGTVGSLGTQEERTVFWSKDNSVGFAPVICYESVYSDFVAKYVRNGANLICIITNDGWWDDTPGYRQHLAYARLRAIETRCQIARSANTGVSCFIDELGNIDNATPYWQEAVIEKNLSVNTSKTFFVRFGDLISYSSAFFAILILLFGQYLRFKKS